MACHLEHRLQWEALRDIYILSKARDTRMERRPRLLKCCPPKLFKQIDHFAGCFVDALHEFRATDKSTDAEMKHYDPKVWGKYEFQFEQAYRLGYYDSLFWGYLELNLLLIDNERIAPLMIPSRYLTPAICVMIGDAKDEQPSEITDHLKPAFEDSKLQPLTPSVLKILRDHAAIMFRCMYSVTCQNKLLDKALIRTLLLGFFDWIHRDWVKSGPDDSYVEAAPECCPWTFIEKRTAAPAAP